MMKLFSQLSTDISIHALLAESDRCCPCAIIAPAISIHALLAESDAAIFFLYCAFPYFYPRSPCGERRFHFNAGQHICVISIHALLAESDLNFHHRRPCCFQFLSTLSLRRATNSRHNFGPKNRFLSTLSLRRATQQPENTADEPRFLSTLSLRRATCGAVWGRCAPQISIHALLAESDHVGAGTIQTPSQISIHALLAESDQLRFLHNLFAVLFLSTLSLRRATTILDIRALCLAFLSTLSLRRATLLV